MKVEDAVFDLLDILNIVSISLHLLGIYLLRQVKNDARNQKCILIHLSSVEIFMSIFDLVYNTLVRENVKKHFLTHILIVDTTCFVIPYFLILTVLTLDRFFEVYLSLTYHVHFSRKVVKRCLLFCWIVGVIQCVLLTILQIVYEKMIDSTAIIFIGLLPMYQVIFLVTSFSVYGYIYYKYRNSLRHPTYGVETTSRGMFFVPNLIIGSFIVFFIIPEVLRVFCFYIYPDMGSKLMLSIIMSFFVVGYLCDACIYILLAPKTRAVLINRIKQFRRRSKNYPHPKVSHVYVINVREKPAKTERNKVVQ